MRLLPRLTERKLCPPALNPRLSSASVSQGCCRSGPRLLASSTQWPIRQSTGRSGTARFRTRCVCGVAPDNIVTIISKHCEAGQGIHTGLATILAEELDADWAQVRVEPAPADRALYKNLQFGSQATGGSNSIPNSWDQYRCAGATARAMLIRPQRKSGTSRKVSSMRIAGSSSMNCRHDRRASANWRKGQHCCPYLLR